MSRILIGERVNLRSLTMDDCTERYVSWLQDPEVNKWLETRWSEQNLTIIKDFVENINNSNHSYLFAMIAIDTNEHIGNIKIGPVHPHYKYADVSYFIGEKSHWGKGIASEAVKLISDFGFSELKLHRLQAGIIEGNQASLSVLKKNGFIMEGSLTKQVYFNNEWKARILLGKLRDGEN